MSTVVLGVFSDRDRAEEAISDLEAEGYDPKDISIAMKDTEKEDKLSNSIGAQYVIGGTLGGAATGAVLGGLAGLVASFMIPGLGAFFIGGPLAAALGLSGAAATTASGAATGAVAGSIIGALTSTFGLSRKEAEIYESRINGGGVLIAVPARDREEREVEEILRDFGADNIRIVGDAERPLRRREEFGREYGIAHFSEIRHRGKKVGRSRR